MAISEHASGSQTATLDTEHVLNGTSPETTDGVFQFFVDLDAMVNGDIVILRVKEKCRASDSQRVVWSRPFAHDQGTDSLAASPSLILLHGWDFTLEQTDGTGRAFPWSIRKVA